MKKCSICGKKYVGYGNNAEPFNSGRCCDACNTDYVIPARLMRYHLGLDPRIVNANDKPNLNNLLNGVC